MIEHIYKKHDVCPRPSPLKAIPNYNQQQQLTVPIYVVVFLDKRLEETCPTIAECATVPTEVEENTTCPQLERDCTCPSTEVNNTEYTPGTYPECDCTSPTCPPLECDCTCPSTEVNYTECPTPGMTNTEGGKETHCICTSETGGEKDEQQKTETVTCTALGGGLGTLAAVLILILVGVVLGWVWSCHRKNKT